MRTRRSSRTTEPRDGKSPEVTAIAPSGSFLAISHMTSAGASTEVLRAIDEQYRDAPVPLRLRAPEEIEVLFGAVSSSPPGWWTSPQWRADEKAAPSGLHLLGSVARSG
ncbi:SAM-dependent methyltransferase [Actinomadura fibrosa]|uniref:SAM-dependent methyltransferase n=1 Tax=Actinomadura fibrosa TaxID=111802 RepID=A0ABW2XK14_9ACTN|nr:SAM-dependent methyltransferase [Actinomadura fibrosa]